MKYSITKDFFVRPELTSFFLNDHGPEMFKQLVERSRGETLEDPLYFIQQVLTLPSNEILRNRNVYNYNALGPGGTDFN